MSILVILAAAFAGCLAGCFALRRIGGGKNASLTGALVVMAAAAAVATNATQLFLDSGLPFTAVDVIEASSYFVFGFSATGAWVSLKSPAWRLLVAILVPIAMYEPLRIAFRLVKFLLR